MKYYRNIKNDEIVYEEEAQDYVLHRLGIKIEPRGEGGEMTLEQLENIESTIEWYFSANWIEEELEEIEKEVDYISFMEDRMYQDDLERKWGIL